MHKLVIPGILLAVIMIAGGFAFIPVEEASTIHDSLLENIKIITCDAAFGVNFYNSTSDQCELVV